ncbi:MAG: hypothetical protein L0L54_09010, partial [Lactococcus sp.]|nr:hypothetical protein [Lactococcus sp.]
MLLVFLIICGVLILAQQYLPVEQLINQVLHSKIFRSNWILIALTVFYQISLIYTIGSETG